MPVILVLFNASRRRAFWLYFQRYFAQDESRRPKKGARTVRLRVPMRQPLTRRAITRMRGFKQDLLDQLGGILRHA
jgi:hypothetical protein